MVSPVPNVVPANVEKMASSKDVSDINVNLADIDTWCSITGKALSKSNKSGCEAKRPQ